MGQHIWGNTYATNVSCLVLLQKKLARLFCGAKKLDNTSGLFCNLHIPDIVELETAVIMYKAYNNSLPMNIHKLFTLYVSVYMTRQYSILKKICMYQSKKYVYIS